MVYGYLRDYSFLITPTHPIRFSRKDMLQVLSAKEVHLVRPRKGVFFSAEAPTLWNNISL